VREGQIALLSKSNYFSFLTGSDVGATMGRGRAGLPWPQCLLLLIFSLTIFSYFLLNPSPVALPSQHPHVVSFVAPAAVSDQQLRPVPPVENFTLENDLLRQSLLRQLSASKEVVRSVRRTKVLMSVNETARRLTAELQEITRCYLISQYGRGKGRVPPDQLIAMELAFPQVMIDADPSLAACVSSQRTRTVFIELAPMMMLPHAFHAV
jgi:hypothetical protein